MICIEAGPLSRKLFWPPILEQLCTYSVVTSELACIRFVRALKLKSKKARKLSSVIKMTKKKAVSTHLNVFFLPLSFELFSASFTVKNIDKQRLT